MKRILIIGCPGSGKSTLAEQLANELELELIHLDRVNWLDDHTTLSRQAFDKQLTLILKKEEWVIDGNYNRTLAHRLSYADTVIWLDLPRIICLYRVIKRYVKGKKTNHQHHGNPKRIDRDFLKFIWRFNQTNRPKMKRVLEGCTDKNIFVLRNNKNIRIFKNNIALMRTGSS
ncbi:AAA family ATPase [Marinilactibacillus kalidii]|uniref:AAA family ATPase n=1 Tax=Marinilactibacillus kalidii TaxID=2820274 RepID=UPI001ABEAFD2